MPGLPHCFPQYIFPVSIFHASSIINGYLLGQYNFVLEMPDSSVYKNFSVTVEGKKIKTKTPSHLPQEKEG